MILAVIEHYHDYGAKSYFLDTTLLDPTNHVDNMIINGCNGSGRIVRVVIDASDWEDSGKYTVEPAVSEVAKIVGESEAIDKVIDLYITFE